MVLGSGDNEIARWRALAGEREETRRNELEAAKIQSEGNEMRLVEAGLTRDTADPSGGEMVRTATGELTGMLREDSATPVREALADYKARRPADVIENEMREQVRLAGEEALANGITSFQDMGSPFEVIDLLKAYRWPGNIRELAHAGVLQLHDSGGGRWHAAPVHGPPNRHVPGVD